MAQNKKIINATETEYNGVKFKSKLEAKAYSLFLEHGLPCKYEGTKVELLEGFYPSTPYYKRGKSEFNLTLHKEKIRAWDYLPDFIIELNGWIFYVEIKGYQNDVSPYKTKMFLHQLEQQDHIVFFMVKTVREIKECINLIKQYANGETT